MARQFFDKASLTDSVLCHDVGHKPERPFIIKAALQETSLGDLVSKLLFVATIKRQFDFAELHIRYRDVRPYSREIVSIIAEIDHSEAIRGDVPAWARLWFPDFRLWTPLARAIDGRRGSWASFCDFYPTDWMLNPRWLHAVPNPAILRIPSDLEDELSRELVALGIDAKKWFAVVHYRASSYLAKRSGHLRNGDPEAHLALVNYIIDDLGGQVVLLGHPALEPFPARAGLADLSRFENSFMLQAFSTSRARFMIAGPSGPVNLGWGFQIPTAMVDLVDGDAGWGPAEQVVLTKKISTPDGMTLQNADAFAAGLLEYRLLRDKIRAGENYLVQANSSEELKAVANHMYRASEDTHRWRAPAPDTTDPRPNSFTWPPQAATNLSFFDP